MEKLTKQTEALMNERFGKDSMIALATADNNTPYVRSVNALYHDRAFYIITYRKSKEALNKSRLTAWYASCLHISSLAQNIT
ncbi:MAG: hypothetical protein MR291_11190 [Oscillospiraceae bacterium]|nr:hypothetical protein [Oscillospiraceae bacterium]